jgi:colicin import membrane protein
VRTGLTVSSVGHALLLGWGLVTFTPRALNTPITESMPIDIVPVTELSQRRAGERDAPPEEVAKPAAKRVDEPAPEHEKKPLPSQQAAAPPASKEPAPQAKPDLAKADAEPVAKPMPPKRQPPPKPRPQTATAPKQKFDPDRIAALLDRSAPPPSQSSAAETAPSPAQGAATGVASRLTQSEIDALRAQIQACWNPPIGAADAPDLVVRVRVQLRPDGSLAGEPQLLNRGGSPYFQVAAESAMRAVRRCQPYSMPAAKYDVWRDVEVTFDPRDMFGG